MMTLKKGPLKLALFLCLVYVGAGVTIFPGWWHSILSIGGLDMLFRAATTEFLSWNILAFGTIALLWFTLEFWASDNSRFRKVTDRFVSSASYIFLVWVIFLVGTARLFAVGFRIGATDLAHLASQVEQLKEGQTPSPVIRGPVDFVFINTAKIDAAYDQTLPQLELERRTVGIKDSGQVSAKAEIPKVAEAGGKLEKEVHSEESYTQSKKSMIRKTVDLVNYVGHQGLLRSIKTIEIQSSELSEFDKAVGLVTKTYKLPLPIEQMANTRQELIDKYLSQDMATKFPINAWVEISGVFTVTGQTNTVTMEFDYVPTFPKRVMFVTSLPCVVDGDNDVSSLLAGGSWEVRVFGKIIRRDDTDGNVRYDVLSLAVYR